jgi:hypothetical protein
MKKITVELETTKGKVTVPAWTTAVPSLVINKNLNNDRMYTVTHRPTTCAIWKTFPTIKAAQKACTVWAEIPGWDTLKPEQAEKFFSTHRAALIEGRDAGMGW